MSKIPKSTRKPEASALVPCSVNQLRQRLLDAVKRDIRNIGCIYRTIGNALYDEPVDRLALRILATIEREQNPAAQAPLPKTKI